MRQTNGPVPTLYWFDRDLRLDDNPALARAAQQASELTCVYCDDAARYAAGKFGIERIGSKRRRFIAQSLSALAASLEPLGQELLQLQGCALSNLRILIDDRGIRRVVRSRHFGFYEQRQWAQLKRERPEVEFVEVDGYTLFRQDQVDAIGKLPPTFSQFRRRAEHTAIISPADACLLPAAPSAGHAAAPAEAPVMTSESGFVGGETAALAHVQAYFASALPSTYKKTRNAIDGWPHSSKMSPWLAAGCLSPRRLYQRLKQYEATQGANQSTYWLFFELLWREYFQWYAREHAEKLFQPGGISGKTPLLEFDPGRFVAWCNGETEWPLVNACMSQLNRTGYLSNRARQIAASALIYELNIDWRAGAAWFERQLIDHDVACNWGNWQYIAGVGADPRGGRHFSIEKQARLFDADGSYVARWLDPARRGLTCGEVA